MLSGECVAETETGGAAAFLTPKTAFKKTLEQNHHLGLGSPPTGGSSGIIKGSKDKGSTAGKGGSQRASSNDGLGKEGWPLSLSSARKALGVSVASASSSVRFSFDSGGSLDSAALVAPEGQKISRRIGAGDTVSNLHATRAFAAIAAPPLFELRADVLKLCLPRAAHPLRPVVLPSDPPLQQSTHKRIATSSHCLGSPQCRRPLAR